MMQQLGWRPLEERRAIAKLTLLHKSVYHKVTIDTDHYQTRRGREGVSTRISSSIGLSFVRPITKKDCYKFSFLPKTFAELNLLPAEIIETISVDSFKTKLKSKFPNFYKNPIFKTSASHNCACNNYIHHWSLLAV